MSGLTARNLAWLFTALLGLVVLSCLGIELFTLGEPILKNYNEGWNAYHIEAAISDRKSLYPPSASLLTNNYPPLSYFIVGAVARLTGDAIIAGRVVSFACAIGIGLCLMLAARAMGCAVRRTIVAALLFWAAPFVIVRFTAMNDPQLLGNFLDAVALVVILASPRDVWHIAMSALFLTLAEFVKPIFITLPLALLVWLFVYERRSAWLLAGFGVLFAIIGYALVALSLHVELLGHIFSPRLFILSKITGQTGQWLLIELLPLAVSLALFRWKDSFAFFAATYAAAAFALALFFSGGDGVSASQMMDVSMAVALGTALYLDRASEARWTYPVMALTAFLQSAMLVLSLLGFWISRPSILELLGTRYATSYDTEVIASHPEPVMCETLALCYWAHRKPQVDAFALRQAVLSGARPASDLTRLMDRQAFSLIQLQPDSNFGPSSPFWDAIARNYYLHHQDRNGLFLVPRDQPLTRLLRGLRRD